MNTFTRRFADSADRALDKYAIIKWFCGIGISLLLLIGFILLCPFIFILAIIGMFIEEPERPPAKEYEEFGG